MKKITGKKNLSMIGFPVTAAEMEAMKDYPSKNFAATRAWRSWGILRSNTLQELKGIFDRKELIFLVEALKDFEPKFAASKMITVARLQESSAEWTFAGPVVAKIGKLTAAQVFFLNDWCSLFYEREDVELLEYVKELEGTNGTN